MMIKGFCSLLLILGLLTGCGGIAAPSGSSSLPSGSSSSLPVASSPAPSSLPETPEKPENPWGLVPLEELGAAAAEDYETFCAALEGSLGHGDRRYFCLCITDPEGAPVPNLMGILGVNWQTYQLDRSGKVNGLSMAGGLLPFFVYEEDSDAILFLVNDDTFGDPSTPQSEPLTMQLEFPGEMLAQWPEGYVLPVVWDLETPAQSIAQGDPVLEVQVLDSLENPVPGRAVYFEPAPWEPPAGEDPDDVLRPSMGWVSPYEPRYTDHDGVARFIPWKAAGSTDPPGKYTIVTTPVLAAYADDGSKKTTDIVETVAADGGWITQYTVTIEPSVPTS